MGRSDTKRSRPCSLRGITLKRATKPLKLPASFDLYDLRYTAPKRKDMAIGLVFFNSSKSKRLLMNYLYVAEKLKVAGIPFYTLEMHLKGQEPEIHDAFHYETDFILFQKERLCHLLEKRIPTSYSKLLFMDCDLVFQNANWYQELSDKLDSFEIVQPFSKAAWLDVTYKQVILERLPITFYSQFGFPTGSLPKPFSAIKNLAKNLTFGGYHPGFAWAFQRKWFQDVGFYEYRILGGGDGINAAAWLGFPYEFQPCFAATQQEYMARMSSPPSLCFLRGSIFHLWHGDNQNRQYKSRLRVFDGVSDVRDMIRTAKNGLFELKDDSLKPTILRYFKDRDDDGV